MITFDWGARSRAPRPAGCSSGCNRSAVGEGRGEARVVRVAADQVVGRDAEDAPGRFVRRDHRARAVLEHDALVEDVHQLAVAGCFVMRRVRRPLRGNGTRAMWGFRADPIPRPCRRRTRRPEIRTSSGDEPCRRRHASVGARSSVPMSLVKVLPFPVHSGGDYLAAALLVVAPFALNFSVPRAGWRRSTWSWASRCSR